MGVGISLQTTTCCYTWPRVIYPRALPHLLLAVWSPQVSTCSGMVPACGILLGIGSGKCLPDGGADSWWRERRPAWDTLEVVASMRC